MLLMPHRFPGLTVAAIAAELARERAVRATFYPRQIDKGRMTESEAKFGLALVDAWAIDLARLRTAFAPVDQGRPAAAPAPPPHQFTWRDRAGGIRRELDHRAVVYARELERGALTQADAAHRIRCLEAMLAIYEDGLDWPTDPQLRTALCQQILEQQSPVTPQQELAL